MREINNELTTKEELHSELVTKATKEEPNKKIMTKDKLDTDEDGSLITPAPPSSVPHPNSRRRRRRGLYDYPDNPWGRRVYGRPQNYGKRRGHHRRQPHKYPYGRRRSGKRGGGRRRGDRQDYDYTQGGGGGGGGETEGDGAVVYTGHSPKTVSFAYAKASGVAKVSKVVG
ncbi:hypothetical protein Pmani_011202 [Petrolisthes manimaculis]|uniref:Uncharacterized protein n=1 Tax=Petrolisthes manimaculis TaxID=1843537 RepID=A0AAE1Q0J3_9EUCA|nr:hypothetical protein Pmani_011202 [Petrolisthes manimaculis]